MARLTAQSRSHPNDRRGLPLLAAGLALWAQLGGPAEARGLLGLFADEELQAPAPTVDDTRPQPADSNSQPVAFVSRLSGVVDPDLMPFDFLRPGQRIDLGLDGEVVLTFFAPCREERITGGTVVITHSGAETDLTSQQQSRAASCRPLDDFSFGGEGHRVPPDEGPFLQRDWFEAVVNARPIFRWGRMAPGSVATLTVTDADQPEPQMVWSIETPYPFAAYPDTAPPLEPGRPYLATVNQPGSKDLHILFSVDLDLSFTRMPLNSLVWLQATRAKP